jgi:hypothetical protein
MSSDWFSQVFQQGRRKRTSNDWFGQVLQNWETSNEQKRKTREYEEWAAQRMGALLPEFWKSVLNMVDARLNIFSQRVGEQHRFQLVHKADYHLEAVKDDFAKATLIVEILPASETLSFRGILNDQDELYELYRLRLNDGEIYVEKSNRREAKRKHVTLADVEEEVFGPFLGAVLNYNN